MSFRGLTESIKNPALQCESAIFGELSQFLITRNMLEVVAEFSPQQWVEFCQEFPEVRQSLVFISCYFLYQPLYSEDGCYAKELLKELQWTVEREEQS